MLFRNAGLTGPAFRFQLACQSGAPYMTAMRKFILFVPLFALLALAIWFVGAAWVHLAGDAIPMYGWFAIGGGVVCFARGRGRADGAGVLFQPPRL